MPRGRIKGLDHRQVVISLRRLTEARVDALASRYKLDEKLADCLKAVHGAVLELGGPGRFPGLVHSALIDPEVSANEKAEILRSLLIFWMVTSMSFERVEHKHFDMLPDGDLIEHVGHLISKHRQNAGKDEERKKNPARPKGRPRLDRKPGDYWFIGPLLPAEPDENQAPV